VPQAIRLAKTYHAKAAGAPEDDAIAAAEELADYQNRFSSIDHELAVVGRGIEVFDARVAGVENRLGVVENRLGAVGTSVATLAGKITVLTWAVGINAAATIAILGMLVRGHG
jgi:hypothetical protein